MKSLTIPSTSLSEPPIRREHVATLLARWVEALVHLHRTRIRSAPSDSVRRALEEIRASRRTAGGAGPVPSGRAAAWSRLADQRMLRWVDLLLEPAGAGER